MAFDGWGSSGMSYPPHGEPVRARRRKRRGIPASKVVIARRYIVDCLVCEQAVEPLSGGFADRQEAQAAKDRHLLEHQAEPAEPDPPR